MGHEQCAGVCCTGSNAAELVACRDNTMTTPRSTPVAEHHCVCLFPVLACLPTSVARFSRVPPVQSSVPASLPRTTCAPAPRSSPRSVTILDARPPRPSVPKRRVLPVPPLLRQLCRSWPLLATTMASLRAAAACQGLARPVVPVGRAVAAFKPAVVAARIVSSSSTGRCGLGLGKGRSCVLCVCGGLFPPDPAWWWRWCGGVLLCPRRRPAFRAASPPWSAWPLPATLPPLRPPWPRWCRARSSRARRT